MCAAIPSAGFKPWLCMSMSRVPYFCSHMDRQPLEHGVHNQLDVATFVRQQSRRACPLRNSSTHTMIFGCYSDAVCAHLQQQANNEVHALAVPHQGIAQRVGSQYSPHTRLPLVAVNASLAVDEDTVKIGVNLLPHLARASTLSMVRYKGGHGAGQLPAAEQHIACCTTVPTVTVAPLWS